MQPFIRRTNLPSKGKSGLNVQTDTIQTLPLPSFSSLIEEFLDRINNTSNSIEYFLYRYLLYLSDEKGSCHNCFFTVEQTKIFK